MLVSLLIFQIFVLFNTFEAAEFDVLTKSVKCYEVNKQIISNYSCKVKVSREFPAGLLYIGFSFKKIKRLNIALQLFYRYGTIYHPYLIKFDLDMCELTQKNSTTMINNKVVEIFHSLLEEEFPLLLKGCPYENLLETNMINLNKSVSAKLPPVVPTGFFKANFRAYIPGNNSTNLMHIDVVFQQRARKAFRAMDVSMMQMG